MVSGCPIRQFQPFDSLKMPDVIRDERHVVGQGTRGEDEIKIVQRDSQLRHLLSLESHPFMKTYSNFMKMSNNRGRDTGLWVKGYKD